jgi:hypothetical protein
VAGRENHRWCSCGDQFRIERVILHVVHYVICVSSPVSNYSIYVQVCWLPNLLISNSDARAARLPLPRIEHLDKFGVRFRWMKVVVDELPAEPLTLFRGVHFLGQRRRISLSSIRSTSEVCVCVLCRMVVHDILDIIHVTVTDVTVRIGANGV